MSAVGFRAFASTVVLATVAATLAAVDARPVPARQHAKTAQVVARFAVPGVPSSFAIGSDGNPWYFNDLNVTRGMVITKVDITTRATTSYPWSPYPSCPICTYQFGRVILNADGNLWFTYTDQSGEPTYDDRIASVSPSAQFQNQGGLGDTYISFFVSDITNGPDGSVWSVQGNYRCEGGSPSCWFAQPPTVMPENFAVPAPLNQSAGVNLVMGTDGDLWEAANGAPYYPAGILRVDPTTGKLLHRYKAGGDGIVAGKQPYSLVAFLMSATAGTVGYINAQGKLRIRTVGSPISSSTIAVAGDGSLWVAAGTDLIRIGTDGRISHLTVTVRTHVVTEVEGDVHGNIWYATQGATLTPTAFSPSTSMNEIGEVQI